MTRKHNASLLYKYRGFGGEPSEVRAVNILVTDVSYGIEHQLDEASARSSKVYYMKHGAQDTTATLKGQFYDEAEKDRFAEYIRKYHEWATSTMHKFTPMRFLYSSNTRNKLKFDWYIIPGDVAKGATFADFAPRWSLQVQLIHELTFPAGSGLSEAGNAWWWQSSYKGVMVDVPSVDEPIEKNAWKYTNDAGKAASVTPVGLPTATDVANSVDTDPFGGGGGFSNPKERQASQKMRSGGGAR